MLGLIEIFYAPGKVFERVRDRGGWFIPILAVVLLGLCAVSVLLNLVGMETMARKQIESNPRAMEQLGPEGVEQRVRAANSPMIKGLYYAAPLVVTPLTLLACSGLFLAGISVVGGNARFSRVLGATAYAWFPYSLLTTAMMTLVLTLAPDRTDLNFQNLIATNVGAFLDPKTVSKPIYSIASSIDLLSFGLIGLLGYGLSKVSGLAFGRTVMVVILIWAVYVLAKTGLSAMF